MIWLTVGSGLGKSYAFHEIPNLPFGYSRSDEKVLSGLIVVGKYLLWHGDWDTLPIALTSCSDETVITTLLQWMEKHVVMKAKHLAATEIWRGYGQRCLIEEHLADKTLVPVSCAYKEGQSVIVCKDDVTADLEDHWLVSDADGILKSDCLDWHSTLLGYYNNDQAPGIKLEKGEFLSDIIGNGLLEEVLDELYEN